MAKHRIYKKPKNGGSIEITARQLTELYEKHDGILASRQYKDLKEMVLADSNVRDAKWGLREYDDETLLGTWDKEIRYGYGKRIYIHLDYEDEDMFRPVSCIKQERKFFLTQIVEHVKCKYILKNTFNWGIIILNECGRDKTFSG